MERHEIEQLAQFNAERGRGLVHTEEYSERMGHLQQQFDEEARMVRAWKGVVTLETMDDDFVEAIPCGDGITRYFPKLRGR